ncbi:MAG: CAP domain-containing protein [Roseburia sp.]
MMRKKGYFKGRIAAGLAVCVFALSANPVVAEAAQWNQDNIGWWYQQDDGSFPVNQWRQIDGQWYYFKSDGYMATGWLWDGSNWYYMGNDGAMRTGWQNIDGTYYYLYEDGHMASDTYIGGYYVDSNGAWVSNSGSGTWIQDGKRWWYRHSDGSYTVNNWEQIDGKWYCFDLAGWMLSDQWIGDYYVGEDGAMVTDDWIDGLYYLDSTGKWDPNKTCPDRLYTIQSQKVLGHFVPAYEAQMVTLINQYRQENGVGTLDTSSEMTNAANTRSYEITYWFSHIRPNGTFVDSLMYDQKYRTMGENVARGYETPEAALEEWKNSEENNANLLSTKYSKVGVGVFAERRITGLGSSDYYYYYYWVVVFYG